MNTRTLAEIPESRINEWSSKMPYTKPVVTNPYFDRPVWIENEVNRKEFICLSSDSTIEEVELFLILLFGYNNVDSTLSLKSSFEELFKEDSVAISGGVAFFEDESKFILPSCCCGLEDWKSVIASLENNTSPWLGHDPTPNFTYDQDNIIVWSDDPTAKSINLISVQYTIDDLRECLKETKVDLLAFIQNPLFQWLNTKDSGIAARMKVKMVQWFF